MSTLYGLIIDPHDRQLPVQLVDHCTGIAEVRVRVQFRPAQVANVTAKTIFIDFVLCQILQKVQWMEIRRTLKLGQMERSYLRSLPWKLSEEQAEMVQMMKLISALFRVWTKDMHTRIQCQRGEFAGIETRVSVCRSILYQFGWVQNNSRLSSGEFERIFKVNNPIQVLHERRVGTRDVLRTFCIQATFYGITNKKKKKRDSFNFA